MAQASEPTGTPVKKKKVVSISDLARGRTPTPPKPLVKTAPKPAAKANPGQPGMTTPTPPSNSGSGGSARGGGGKGRSATPAPHLGMPDLRTPAVRQPRYYPDSNPRMGGEPGAGYNLLRTDVPRPRPVATVSRGYDEAGLRFRDRPPAPSAPTAARYANPAQQFMPSLSDNQQENPAQMFMPPGPPQTLPVTGAATPYQPIAPIAAANYGSTPTPNISDRGRAGAGMAVGGNGIPAAPPPAPWVRGATQGATTGGFGAYAGSPLLSTAQAVMPGAAAAGGGYAGGVPNGVDPVWYNQFMAEHGGQTPEQVYQYDDNPIQRALWDKAWGDQFLDGNYRAPGQEDWANTAGMRYGMYARGQNIYGQGGMGGGGGGGGGGGAPAPVAAASTIPQLYQAGFNLAFGQPGSTYYTPERGGEKQMQADYYALHDIFQNALQRPVDPGEWERIWRDLLAYKAGRPNQAAPLSMAEVYGFANRMVQRTPQPPEISNLNLSEI